MFVSIIGIEKTLKLKKKMVAHIETMHLMKGFAQAIFSEAKLIHL